MMISEQNLNNWVEHYRNGQLTPAELEVLENTLRGNDHLKTSWEETLDFFSLMDEMAKRQKIRKKIQSVAVAYKNEIASPEIQDSNLSNKRTNTVSLLSRKNVIKLVGMAAALILISTLVTYLVTKEKSPNTGSQYTLLRREIENIKHSQSKIIDSLQQSTITIHNPLYGGTGFAIANNGYVATNYHVVKDAKDIYVETAKGETYSAYLVAFEPQTDVAILKIEDKNFRFGKTRLPYHFAKNISGLGQRVFTLGYPQDNIVYNEGYISCEHGFDNDSTSYQLEMVANPGQSGAPVLDQSGDVVALVTGKQSNTSGTTFAVHTQALLQLIHSLPEVTQKKIQLPSGSLGKNLSRIAQVNRIRQYVCSIKAN